MLSKWGSDTNSGNFKKVMKKDRTGPQVQALSSRVKSVSLRCV